LDEAVIAKRVRSALLALAERVKAVSELAGSLGAGSDLRDEIGRGALAA
jgi:hypothetical protein